MPVGAFFASDTTSTAVLHAVSRIDPAKGMPPEHRLEMKAYEICRGGLA